MQRRAVALGLTIALSWAVLLVACGQFGSFAQIQTGTAIADCEAAGRLAEAGQHLHTYDECMKDAGLHE